ncbi:MAG: hypothetical protein KAI14_05935 [Dehalococcoidales bacterium]|nr:hypothetical protein [Dehalococcoidales bacterium]
MAQEQYREGTISVTNGSAVVTGLNTLWDANVVAGAVFKLDLDGDATYVIASVDSDTQITLSANYAGDTDSGQSYMIQRSFTPNMGYARPVQGDADLADILREQVIDKIDTDMESKVDKTAFTAKMLGNINDPLLHIPMRRANDAVRLSGSETFTRTTTGTYIDQQDGLIKSAAIDTPRYERMADGGVGILIEGASTNKLLYSEELDNAAWGKTEATVTANAIVSPDGNTTADKVIPSVVFAAHHLLQNLAVTSGTIYTQTFYIKAAGYQYVQLTGSVGFPLSYVNFDIINGDITANPGAVDATITPLKDGWFRISLPLTATSTESGRIILAIINSGTATRLENFAGDGASGIYVWGAQIEELPFASSYIPTTTTSVARGADNYSVAFGGNIQKPGGKETWVCDADMIGKQGTNDDQTVFTVVGESHRLMRTNSAGQDGKFQILYGNNNSQPGNLLNADTVYRLGTVHDGTNFYLWQDGTLTHQKASVAITGSGTSINIGNLGGSAQLFGHIRNLRLYDKALTDSEMKVA